MRFRVVYTVIAVVVMLGGAIWMIKQMFGAAVESALVEFYRATVNGLIQSIFG